MKMLLSALFVAAIFWLIRPETSPTNINNQVPQVVKATQVDKASVELPQAERAQAKPETVEPVGETAVAPPAPQPTPLTDKEQLMQAAGIPQSEWSATDYIVSRESSWNHLAVNAESGATGLCQSLPASKMASAGADYMTNPVTQLRWCHQYAQQRYSGWWSAHAFWLSNKWW